MSTERFLGQLLHDIRNRLNGIILQATDVQETLAEQGVRADLSPVVGQVMALAEELKRVRASIEPGPARVRPTEMREWWLSLQEQVGLGGQIVTWGETPTGLVELDPEKLTCAVLLLLDNATRYGQEGTKPRVDGAVKGGRCVIAISNTLEEAPEAQPPALERWPELGWTTRSNALGAGCYTALRLLAVMDGRVEWQVDQVDGHKQILATLTIRTK